jgi:hypothetical protein
MMFALLYPGENLFQNGNDKHIKDPKELAVACRMVKLLKEHGASMDQGPTEICHALTVKRVGGEKSLYTISTHLRMEDIANDRPFARKDLRQALYANAAKNLVAIVLLADEYLKLIKTKKGAKEVEGVKEARRFFRMLLAFPFELQSHICSITEGKQGFVRAKDFDAALEQILPSIFPDVFSVQSLQSNQRKR